MKRSAASLVAAILLSGTLTGTALAQYDRSNPNDQGRQGWNSGGDQGRDGWGSDRGRFGRFGLGGSWTTDNGSENPRGDRGGFRGRPGMRQMMLPDFIRIDQRPSMVRIADARNRPIQTIMLGGKFDSRGGDRPDYVLGRWHGATLVVETTGPRGGTITQSFTLEDRGRTLVVRTRREGQGPRTMEMTSTYHRA